MGIADAFIVIPEGVEKIESYAFHNNLKELSIPDTVKELGKNLFECCEQLTFVSLPKTLKRLPYGVFADCPALKIGHGRFSAAIVYSP